MSVNPNVWPIYSFVQDSGVSDDNDIYHDPAMCLPLSSWLNLKCQVILDFTNPFAQIAGIYGAGGSATSKVYLTPVSPDFACSYAVQDFTGAHRPVPLLHHDVIESPAGPPADNSGTNIQLYFENPRDGGDMSLTTLANNTITIAVGDCVKFALVWDIIRPSDSALLYRNYFGCTNMFRRTDANSAYTSVISYRNESDAFGFHYTGPNYGSNHNLIELPCYLRDPTMPSEEKVYVRSDGSSQLLYQRKDEQYELETDSMPYVWHKNLDIALSHDSVSITGPNIRAFDPVNTASEFVKKDNYEIEYNKAPFSAFGKGQCKLINANPVHLINNNCE